MQTKILVLDDEKEIADLVKQKQCKRYFLHKNGTDGYTLQATDETPFFHHIAILSRCV